MQRNKILLYILFSLFLITGDQTSKYIIRKLGGFYICNENLAFGLKISNFLFYLLLILIVFLIVFIFRNSKSEYLDSKQFQNTNDQNLKNMFRKFGFRILNLFIILDLDFSIWPIILILSGGLSNIIDRIYLGCVIDFIDLNFWPVFNFADIYITIGVILIIFHNFKPKKLIS